MHNSNKQTEGRLKRQRSTETRKNQQIWLDEFISSSLTPSVLICAIVLFLLLLLLLILLLVMWCPLRPAQIPLTVGRGDKVQTTTSTACYRLLLLLMLRVVLEVAVTVTVRGWWSLWLGTKDTPATERHELGTPKGGRISP